MTTISYEQFIINHTEVLTNTINGESSKVLLGNGHSAVIISETEFEMLKQALRICTEHPEWTISN